MNITPLEIRQKDFEKVFRGYDKDEVTAFLQSLSQFWEKVIDENKELKIKLEASQKEVEKLREVESSLFKTLKTAEDTGANMIDQANKTAELHLKETQLKSESLMVETRDKVKEMIENADNLSRQTMEETEGKLKELIKSFRAIEVLRDDLLDEIKRTSNDTLEKVEKTRQRIEKINIEEILDKAKALQKSENVKSDLIEQSFPKEIQEEIQEDLKTEIEEEVSTEPATFDSEIPIEEEDIDGSSEIETVVDADDNDDDNIIKTKEDVVEKNIHKSPENKESKPEEENPANQSFFDKI